METNNFNDYKKDKYCDKSTYYIKTHTQEGEKGEKEAAYV